MFHRARIESNNKKYTYIIIEIRRAKIRQCGPWKFTAWNFNWLVCFNDKRKNTSAIFSGNLTDIPKY